MNDKVLHVMKSVYFDQGGGVGDLPLNICDEDIPEPKEEDFKTKKEYKYAVEKRRTKLRNNHSLKCDFRLKLDQAEKFNGVSIVDKNYELNCCVSLTQ